MTDNEIINEWKDEIHRAEYIDSSYCDCIDLILIKNTLDLINRQQAEKEALIAGQETMSKYIEEQQAEIERLQADNKTLENVIKNTFLEKAGLDIDPLAEVKTEAIKKFAEKLNEKAQIADCFNSYNMVVGTYFIDDLLKEMVGDNNA